MAPLLGLVWSCVVWSGVVWSGLVWFCSRGCSLKASLLHINFFGREKRPEDQPQEEDPVPLSPILHTHAHNRLCVWFNFSPWHCLDNMAPNGR
jgi:hypothetical protein